MGTKADFYVGRGPDAEWIGSIAMDSWPDGHVASPKFGVILDATDESSFRERVARLIAGVSHGTPPSKGWPWSWDDSLETDYAYAFEDGKVLASCFGRGWFDPHRIRTDEEVEQANKAGKVAFPNMAYRNREQGTAAKGKKLAGAL